jgi:hypothetical protein
MTLINSSQFLKNSPEQLYLQNLSLIREAMNKLDNNTFKLVQTIKFDDKGIELLTYKGNLIKRILK